MSLLLGMLHTLCTCMQLVPEMSQFFAHVVVGGRNFMRVANSGIIMAFIQRSCSSCLIFMQDLTLGYKLGLL